MLKFKIFVLIEIIFSYLVFASENVNRLKQRQFYTLHKWTRGIELTFPSESERSAAISAGYYDLNRIQLPVDIDIEYKGIYV